MKRATCLCPTPPARLATALLLQCLLLGACQVPSVQPFAERTAELGATYREVSRAPEATALRIQARIDPGDTNAMVRTYVRNGRAMSEALGANIVLIDGLARYSAALATIAAASASGAERAQATAGAFEELLDAVGLVPGPSVALTAAFTSANRAIANVRAAGSMREAVAAADPTIQAVAAELRQMLATPVADFVAINEVAVRAAAEDLLAIDVPREAVASLVARRRTLVGGLTGALASCAAGATCLNEARAQELERIDALLARYRAELDDANATIAAVMADQRAMARLVVDTAAIVGAWAETHRVLAQRLQSDLPPDTTLLASLMEDIRTQLEGTKGD